MGRSKGTSHEGRIEKKTKQFCKPQTQVTSRAAGIKKPQKAAEEMKTHWAIL